MPTDILITNLKPDIVISNYETKSVTLVELTVPFDENILAANTRKKKRYETLINDIQEKGFTVKLYAIEISSRGYISPDNLKRLKSLMNSISAKQFREFRLSLQKIAIICSYCIFYSKFERGWIDPPLVSV